MPTLLFNSKMLKELEELIDTLASKSEEFSKLLEELNNLHNSLLTTIQDVQYQEAYLGAKENIRNFINKSGGEANTEIEACLIALYGFLMLKLKSSDISSATKDAMQTFSKLIAILVDRHNKLKKGELLFSSEKSN
jgi:uncharacterized protein YdcH (DUF465 family)